MAFSKKTIKDINLKGKTVLLRADYNVPTIHGQVTDDYRIKKSLPTVKYLLDSGCKLIICSHLGRPEGQNNPEYSMHPVAIRLEELLKKPVLFVSDCVGPDVEAAAKSLKPDQILVKKSALSPRGRGQRQSFCQATG